MPKRIGFAKDQLPAPGFKRGETPKPVLPNQVPTTPIAKALAADPGDGDAVSLAFWYRKGNRPAKDQEVPQAEKAWQVDQANFYPKSQKELISIYVQNQSGKDGINLTLAHLYGNTDTKWMSNGTDGVIQVPIEYCVGLHSAIYIWAHPIPSGWVFPYELAFAFDGEHGLVDISVTIKNWDL